jgi:two-component system, LytTR family, sensor kinase
MPNSVIIQLALILVATVLMAVAIYLLSIYKRLFSGVRSIWVRRNLAVLSVAILFMSAFVALQSPEMISGANKKGLPGLIVKQLGQITIIVLFVFNIVWLVTRIPAVKAMSFIKHHAVIMLSIVIPCLTIYATINYIDHGMKFSNLHATLVFAYYNSVVTGLIYTAVNYVELERKRKLNEKELEVTRLMALKTKAELDALHSKVNPHFLYNALNSIADLSITDGKKARKMTIALADLFRYSINYSHNNYSTVNDEVAMTEIYLQIEKIRFEDQLNYSVKVDEETGRYLVPRFLLQPLAENAVKHGLKATGQMTEIFLEVKKADAGLLITISDNGPAFPEELTPGYGVKSVFDKMDLLFPGQYEIHFTNQSRKQVAIHIHKLMKNELGV